MRKMIPRWQVKQAMKDESSSSAVSRVVQIRQYFWVVLIAEAEKLQTEGGGSLSEL